MPSFRGTRPLKRWRYVGVFTDDLMVCAAAVQVGPARQFFWALLDRRDGRLRQRTRLVPKRGALDLSDGRLCLYDEEIALELELGPAQPVEVVCPHGQGYVWTRKQAGGSARGTLAIGAAPPRPVRGRAVVDDTAGYHARVTEWRWAAGVGATPDDAPVAFNLVEGVNDPAAGSERAVWVDGVPLEVPPVEFSEDLSALRTRDGACLRFHAESERRRSENLLLVRSDYRAPFGTFSGTLPGGVELEHGLGVMEHHRARW